MARVGQAAIVAAARDEFAASGYGSASIRAIAKRAGVSLSALYYYYENKQELLRAILNADNDEYSDRCDEALAGCSDDPAERLEALVGATVRFRARHPAKSSIMLTEQRSLEPEFVDQYRKRLADSTARFTDVITAGIASGQFRTPYPDDARRSVIAACNAISQWYRLDGAVSEDELVDRYVSIALTIVEYQPRAPRRARS